MITSMYFYRNFTSNHNNIIDREDIGRVLKLGEILRRIGIGAYSCHPLQHAIIFYADLDLERNKNKALFTPNSFIHTIRENNLEDTFINALCEALHKKSEESCRENIEKWYNNINRYYEGLFPK